MNENHNILDEFIDSRGFDSMSLIAIKDLMFKHLMERDEYKDMQDFELAMRLKVTASKVATLRKRYDIAQNSLAEIEKRARANFASVYKEDGGESIVMQVDDPLVKEYFESLLRKEYLSFDTSHNKSLMVLPPVSFLHLALKFNGKAPKVWSNKEKKDLENFYKKAEPSGKEKFFEATKNNSFSLALSCIGYAASAINDLLKD